MMDNVNTNCFYVRLPSPHLPNHCIMRFVSPLFTSLSPWRVLAIALIAFSCEYRAEAQYGVSPSQTGTFFDDLRGRAGNKSQQTAIRQGGEYDFNAQEGYQSGTGSVFEDASRQLSQGYNGMGNVIYSTRQAGDYTQYSSPYPASSTYFAPPYTSDPQLGGKRNLKLGPVNLGFGLSTLWEYNDNITRSGTDPVSDLIGSAYLNISANYPITETTSLSLSSAIGFDHYFNHPELSPYGEDFVLNVLPGTTLALDGKIGPVYVVVYDRASVRPAIQNYNSLNDRGVFGVFQNDAGMGANWSINSSLNLSLNYVHSDAMAMEDKDKKFDRSTDSLQTSLAWSPTGVWTTGLEGGYTWLRYPEHYNNDGTMLNAGAFFAMPIGKSTSIRIAGGVQKFNFEPPPYFKGSLTDDDKRLTNAQDTLAALQAQKAQVEGDRTLTPEDKAAQLQRLDQQIANADGQVAAAQTNLAQRTTEYNSNNRDSSDLTDYYASVTISNRLSSRISQALNFGHESTLNITSNFITADYISYGLGIIAWSGSRLSISGYYENAKDSGGTLAQDIEQWGIDAYLSHQLTSRLRMGIGYHYGISDSNAVNRDYTQHAFNVDLNYALSRKLSVTVGYRFFTTNADDPAFEFDQNRVVMSANYNF